MDTLSDMLTRIKNAQLAGKKSVLIRDAKMNREVCNVLVDEGFIAGFAPVKEENKSSLSVELKYYDNAPVINDVKRMSRPSLRKYSKAIDIPKNVDGFGVIVISTSKGIMSDRRAKAANVGGEMLFFIN